MTQVPNELGFYFPAEWEEHEATWMGWPFDDMRWRGNLHNARADFGRLISTIARFEKVMLACASEEVMADAKAHLGMKPNIEFYLMPLNDTWFRDIAPLFVVNEKQEIALTDWRFNGWGNRFAFEHDARVPERIAAKFGFKRFEAPVIMEGGSLEINASSVCLTTRQCLLNQNRNPNSSQADIEHILKDYLGVKYIIWLHNGLEGDHTDGHIDTITRWVSDSHIITSICEDKQDANYAPMQENLTLLKTLRQPNGDPYQITELPLPKKRLYSDTTDSNSERLPLTYANFYIGNGFVVMPTYEDVNDAAALAILQSAFSNREVVGQPSLAIVAGGGSFHCVTQQQPKVGKSEG